MSDPGIRSRCSLLYGGLLFRKRCPLLANTLEYLLDMCHFLPACRLNKKNNSGAYRKRMALATAARRCGASSLIFSSDFGPEPLPPSKLTYTRALRKSGAMRTFVTVISESVRDEKSVCNARARACCTSPATRSVLIGHTHKNRRNQRAFQLYFGVMWTARGGF